MREIAQNCYLGAKIRSSKMHVDANIILAFLWALSLFLEDKSDY